jgi:oleate hydratase
MGPKAYLVGGGIGSLAAAAFMIRDAGIPGAKISILESASVMGGSLDGAGSPAAGYSMRGGRMLTTDNYECTWDLYKSIPSLDEPDRSVLDETVAFNEKHPSHARARLVDSRKQPSMSCSVWTVRSRSLPLTISRREFCSTCC